MLIAPHIHCFGLLLAAMLISDVHAMPMDRHKRSSPPSEVMNSFDEQPEFIFGHTNSMFPSSRSNSIYSSDAPPPGSPSNSIHSSNTHPPGSPSHSVHSSDAPPRAESAPLRKEEWSGPYRATVLAHTETVLDLTVPPVDHPKLDINTNLEFGTKDRKEMTWSIKDALGRANFGQNDIRYTNEFTKEDTAWTKMNGVCVFVFEGRDALCKHRPCVGWRMRSGDDGKLVYISVYQLDADGRSVSTMGRYAKKELPAEQWAAFDERFWARFPHGQFGDPRWAELKGEIDGRDRREMSLKKDRGHVAAAEASKRKESGHHEQAVPVAAKLRKIAPAPPGPGPGSHR
ncbi:hypothetical protein BDP27DRAFT_1362461 [Rhodocollybia butyracea]|uniref:Uncharacterized protein n=1 Tax=Rhodocollybia butyracea TaxID=206335 RepID=A0A9P5U954_9AGAR|nr:hypothetical protein BDP27DRAFT_1362461 [Rhodocollybia butyracea]